MSAIRKQLLEEISVREKEVSAWLDSMAMVREISENQGAHPWFAYGAADIQRGFEALRFAAERIEP